MNTILSIDLDILFSPYIGIYNNDISGIKSSEMLWADINNKYHTEDFIPNLEYIKLINKIIKKYSAKVKKIYIGLDHDSILEAIELEKHNLQQPYLFNLHNIDYHHDIFYGKDQAMQLELYNTARCGNWVGFLTHNQFINEYYWYYGQGSAINLIDLQTNYKKAIPDKFIQIPFQQINTSINLNIDILFICISMPWIPIHQYEIIENIITKIPQQKIHYLKNPYFINNEGKDFLNIHKNSSFNYFNNLLNNI